MVSRNLALNPTYDVNAAAGSERSVQSPLPSRVLANVAATTRVRLLRPVRLCWCIRSAPTPEALYYLCGERDARHRSQPG